MHAHFSTFANPFAKLLIIGAASALIAVSVPTPSLAQVIPSFQGLGFLTGGGESFAAGVSGDGLVVVGQDRNTASQKFQAFRWTAASGMVGLGFLSAGDSSSAAAVNADGSVIVGSADDGGTPSAVHAVRWVSGGSATSLGFIGSASGVSGDGSVVVGNSNGQAVRWVNGVLSNLGFLGGTTPVSRSFGVSSDGLVVVGESTSDISTGEAFRWSGGIMTGLGFLAGHNGSTADAANANGSVIVGQSRFVGPPGPPAQPFRFSGGIMTSLNCDGFANATNADGSVIVGVCPGGAFRWTAATGIISIQNLLTAQGVDTTGWQLTNATGVSADGTVIVGIGVDPNGKTQAWIARLPIVAGAVTATHGYDGDGKSDILWRQDIGGVAIWEMNGGAVKASIGVGFAGIDWTIVGTGTNVLGSGDFNNDGRSDILWRQNTGGIALWTMNGGAVIGSFGIGFAGNDWTIVD